MNEREQCESIAAARGFGCPVDECTDCVITNLGCSLGDCRPEAMVAFAKKWIGDHPDKPKAGPSPIYKGASRGESTYSLSLNNDRISLYRFHGQDSESVDFGGTVEDFNQFEETRPEEWFDVAAKMIAGRK